MLGDDVRGRRYAKAANDLGVAAKLRAGYGIRTHDVQLGKLTLYH
jgi:hypothetical protein